MKEITVTNQSEWSALPNKMGPEFHVKINFYLEVFDQPSDGTIYSVEGGTINYVKGGTINSVEGGTINYVEGGTINYVKGGTINSVKGGTIYYVKGGTINSVEGGTINYVGGTAILHCYWDKTILLFGFAVAFLYGKSKAKKKSKTSYFVRISIKTAAQWCMFHGVKVTRGVAVIYKGLDKNFKARRKDFYYKPESIPLAPDWDGGAKECGGGLHFSPNPPATIQFNSGAVRFVACPVALKDMRPPKNDDEYPAKIKAKGCCAPIWEVTIGGEKVK